MQDEPNKLQSHDSKQRTNALLAAYALITIGISTYIAFADIWPITYFQELMADDENMYPVKTVFLMNLLAVGLVLFPIYYIIKLIVDRKSQNESMNSSLDDLDRDCNTYSFEYAAAVNTISIDKRYMLIKTGFVKKQFSLGQLQHFYLVSKNHYQTLFITYIDEFGKYKKAAMNADPGDPEMTKLMKELNERFQNKSLNHLSQSEAFKKMNVTNPTIIVFIILGVILAIGGAIFALLLN